MSECVFRIVFCKRFSDRHFSTLSRIHEPPQAEMKIFSQSKRSRLEATTSSTPPSTLSRCGLPERHRAPCRPPVPEAHRTAPIAMTLAPSFPDAERTRGGDGHCRGFINVDVIGQRGTHASHN